MPSHQLGRTPRPQVMLSPPRRRLPSQGWGAASSSPGCVRFGLQLPLRPAGEVGTHPPAEERAGAITPPTPPGHPWPRSPRRPGAEARPGSCWVADPRGSPR